MSDYISREAALNELGELLTLCRETLPNMDGHHFVVENEIRIAFDHLAAIPAADVVEVVRCRDCKHWFRIKKDCILASCDLDGLIRHEDFFCASGARMVNDDV